MYSECHLVQRILGAWEENDRSQGKGRKGRKGYMGHLTKMANLVHAKFEAKVDDSGLRDSWSSFADGKLADINAKNVIIPASSYSAAGNGMSSSEDDDADFKDLHFPQESALQQVRY